MSDYTNDILEGFEIEENLDLKKGAAIVGEKRDDISELIRNIWAAIKLKLTSPVLHSKKCPNFSNSFQI